MTTKLDLSKPIVTRGGLPYRIYCHDGGGLYPIHGAIKYDDCAYWTPVTWNADGKFNAAYHKHDRDLINVAVPIKLKRWVRIDRERDNDDSFCTLMFGVKPKPRPGTLAIIEIDIDTVEGEGL